MIKKRDNAVFRTQRRRAPLYAILTTASMLLFAVFIGLALFASPQQDEVRWLGMEVEPLSRSLREGLGLSESQRGVVVSDVIGQALSHGVREGDVIVGVNGQPVADLGELAAIKEQTLAVSQVGLEINRQGQILTAVIDNTPNVGPTAAGLAPAAGGVQAALPPGCVTCPNAGSLMPAALPPGCVTCPNAGSLMPAALPPGCVTCPNAGGLTPVALPPGCAGCPAATVVQAALPPGCATCPNAGTPVAWHSPWPCPNASDCLLPGGPFVFAAGQGPTITQVGFNRGIGPCPLR